LVAIGGKADSGKPFVRRIYGFTAGIDVRNAVTIAKIATGKSRRPILFHDPIPPSPTSDRRPRLRQVESLDLEIHRARPAHAGPTDRPALIEGVALRARDISLISSGKGSLNPIP
jgi:hypothetical protein